MRYPDGIDIIDNGLFGLEKYGATYVLGKEKRALIDVGVSYSKEKILSELSKRDIPFKDISFIFLTHIHMDHAGATGFILDELPEAKVVVHKRGSSHLIDPERLIESVKRATGERFEKYGEMKAVPSERVISISEEEKIELGGKEVLVLPTTGHAPHHLSFFDTSTKSLFCGDAAGINMSGHLYPTTPPPNFHLERSLKSLDKMKEISPNFLLYSHYGLADNAVLVLERYRQFLKEWVDRVESSLNDNTLEKAKNIIVDNYRDKLDSRFNETELRMNVEGVYGYLKK